MFSKVRIAAPVLYAVSACAFGALGFFGASCTVGESRPADAPVQSRAKLQCIQRAKSDFVSLVEGKGSQEDANRMAETIESCASNAILEFVKLTKGKDQGKFTPREIRDFLQTYYLGELKISDELLEKILRVREGVFGARSRTLDGNDLSSFIASLHTVVGVLRDVHPYLPLEFSRANALDPKAHAEMLASLSRAATTLSSLCASESAEAAVTPYSFGELKELVVGSADAFGFADAGSVGTFGKYFDLVLKVKRSWLAPDRPADELRARDLRLFVADGMDVLTAGLGILYTFEHEGMTMGPQGRDRVYVSANRAIDVVERAVRRRSLDRATGGIPIDELKKLILDPRILGEIVATPVGASKAHLRERTVEHLVDTVALRVLSQDDVDLRRSPNLSVGHLNGLRRMLREWRALKGYIDQNAEDGITRARLVPQSDADRERMISALAPTLDFTVDANLASRIFQFREYLRAAPATYDSDEHALMAPGLRDRAYSPFELNLLTMLRPLVSTLSRAYAANPAGLDLSDGKGSGLTVDEFGGLVTDIWDLLVDLQFLSRMDDQREDTEMRFREASIFNFMSDGDDRMSVHEGTQLILALAEAKSLSHKMHSLAGDECALGAPDEFGVPMIDPVCFREKILDFSGATRDSRDLWADFPRLRDYFARLSPGDREEYLRLVEVSGRKFGYEEKRWFDSSDSEAISCLVRYVEMVFERYDQNPRNGTLDPAEAEVAYPIFRGQLAKFKPGAPEDRLHAAFTWMLAKGTIPGQDPSKWYTNLPGLGSWAESVSALFEGYAIWEKCGYDGCYVDGPFGQRRYRIHEGWTFAAPRMNVMTIFGILSNRGRKPESGSARR